jgi:AraC-like DNA-binding protein
VTELVLDKIDFLSSQARTEINSSLLLNREQFTSSDVVGAVRHIIDLTKGRSLFSTGNPSKFTIFSGAQVRIGDTPIQVVQWKSEGICEILTRRSPEHHITLHFPLKGNFEVVHNGSSLHVHSGQLLMVNMAGSVQRRWKGESELLNLVIDRKAIEQVLISEFGIDMVRPLKFEQLSLIDVTTAMTIFRFVETIWLDLHLPNNSCFAHPVLGQQTERTLLSLLLKALPHTYSDQINQGQSLAVPYYVRRVEQYIHLHASEDLSLDTLVQVSGVSERSLHYAFKSCRGTTPMKYLKLVRLDAARSKLKIAQQTRESVTEIAMNVGYSILSHFSRDYKARFNETPIETRDRK